MGSKESLHLPPTAADNEGLVKPIYKDGRFSNPFETWEENTLSKGLRLFKAFLLDDESKIPWNNKEALDTTLPILPPDFDRLSNPPHDTVQFMWVGHASVLVQFDGLTVLTDPVWAARCGPFGIMGPKRYRDTPCKIEDLPHIDAVVISHNHYDHLDHEAVVKLNRKFGKKLRWYVAAGQRKWMLDNGCENVVELTWWQEDTLVKDNNTFIFAATPAQHWCKRTATDTNKALWCSWVIKGPTQSFYFAGDTGYCCGFQQIGRKYGPFSLSAIPIGAYEPRWFMRPQHVNVEEAVTIHEELKSRHSVGVHWGTFRLTNEYYLEPREKLADIVKARGLEANAFITVKHGDVVTVSNTSKLRD